MAVSLNNQLGATPLIGGGRGALDIYESCANEKSNGLAYSQPFGAMAGKALLQPAWHGYELNQRFITTGSVNLGTVAVQEATSTLPPFVRSATSGANNDTNQIILARSTSIASGTLVGWHPWVIRSGQYTNFRIRIRPVTDVTNTGIFVGIGYTGNLTPAAALQTSAIGANLTDCIGFYKAPGATTLYGIVRGASATVDATHALLNLGQANSAYALTADTWYDLEFRVNGTSSVDFFVQGSGSPFNSNDVGGITRTLPTTSIVMTTIIAHSAGTTGAARTLDYIPPMVAQEAL